MYSRLKMFKKQMRVTSKKLERFKNWCIKSDVNDCEVTKFKFCMTSK